MKDSDFTALFNVPRCFPAWLLADLARQKVADSKYEWCSKSAVSTYVKEACALALTQSKGHLQVIAHNKSNYSLPDCTCLW